MRIITYFFIIAIILFSSCNKEGYVGTSPGFPRSPVANGPDSLTGREFVFDSLLWTEDDWGNPLFYMENRDLFSNPARNVIIKIRQDSSNIWEPVFHNQGSPQYTGYFYNIGYGTLAIWPFPRNPYWIDKIFFMKITFL